MDSILINQNAELCSPVPIDMVTKHSHTYGSGNIEEEGWEDGVVVLIQLSSLISEGVALLGGVPFCSKYGLM